MRIVFDSAKDAANQSKHGLALGLAAELDWEAALVWVDERFAYDELRMVALAPRAQVFITWLSSIGVRRGGSSAYAEPIGAR